MLTRNVDQFAAAIEGFFWPKFFFDFLTTNFDPAVKGVPLLQIVNLVIAIITFAYEWPLKFLAVSRIHSSLVIRLLWMPFASLSAILLYQTTNPALYYMIATIIYYWAYCEGEVICPVPWTLPKRNVSRVVLTGDKV